MVYVRNVGGELVASAPEMSRGFMEVRGLGIVNITTLFGLKSIRHNKRLDLIVTLIPAKDQEALDRLGLEREGLDVLGEKVLHVQLSVAPGRDIARLVEVAAWTTISRTWASTWPGSSTAASCQTSSRLKTRTDKKLLEKNFN